MTEREYGTLAADRVPGGAGVGRPARVVVPSVPRRARRPVRRLARRLRRGRGAPLVRRAAAHGAARDSRTRRGAAERGGTCGSGSVVPSTRSSSSSTTPTRRRTRPRSSPGCCSRSRGHDFSKGYYARVEDGSLYGRLFRLFFRPLVRALADATERREPGILEYLDAFRYALAGEFATTDLVSRLRVQRGWGLEVGRSARRSRTPGFAGSARRSIWVGTSTTTAPSTGRPGSPT